MTRSSDFPAAASSIPRSGVNELVTDRRGAATPFDYGNQQGASATAGFTKTLWNGVGSSSMAGCGKEIARRVLQSPVCIATSTSFSSTYNDAHLQTWSLTPRLSIKNEIFGLPSQILTGIDYYDATSPPRAAG